MITNSSSVYQGETVLGTAILEHLDPPMGVAFGPFSPSDRYDRDQHANTIEGHYVGDKGQSMSVRADLDGPPRIASIAIEDWADPEFGKHLTLWFRDSDEFKALFSAHDDFKAYWAR